jgi:hypothetical protein
LIPLPKDEKSDTRKKQNPHDDFRSFVAVPLKQILKAKAALVPSK